MATHPHWQSRTDYGKDIFKKKANREGYRARSAYKLLQLDDSLKVLEGVAVAVDLCAAPGGWTQVLQRRLRRSCLNPVIVAVDLCEVAALDAVTIIRGDITQNRTTVAIREALGGRQADVVVCDGAPEVTGVHGLDEVLQQQLVASAMCLAVQVLRVGGVFLTKVFAGSSSLSLPLLQAQAMASGFASVQLCKPDSSRGSSAEAFLICTGLQRSNGLLHGPRGFLECGDLDDNNDENSAPLDRNAGCNTQSATLSLND
jgi:tRNA (cytidine32/guanosine34-2'-O)-methyltransferase